MTDRQILYEFQKFLLILGGLVVVWFVFSNLKIIARKVLANVQRDLRFKEFNWRSKLTISAEISLHSHFGEKKYLIFLKIFINCFHSCVVSACFNWSLGRANDIGNIRPHISHFFLPCVTYHMISSLSVWHIMCLPRVYILSNMISLHDVWRSVISPMHHKSGAGPAGRFCSIRFDPVQTEPWGKTYCC